MSEVVSRPSRSMAVTTSLLLTTVGSDQQTSCSLRQVEVNVLERLFPRDTFRIVALIREAELLHIDREIVLFEGHVGGRWRVCPDLMIIGL